MAGQSDQILKASSESLNESPSIRAQDGPKGAVTQVKPVSNLFIVKMLQPITCICIAPACSSYELQSFKQIPESTRILFLPECEHNGKIGLTNGKMFPRHDFDAN